ncbi:acryloyl-CoA reductase [Enterococcus ratti]|uniref:YhdH/YhfP family quinone oxidoreductase n=1 Tax=Enterococcus ratti TaxID=150033 RepID=A0A1L8WFJ8_9ENTE|nr:acryloyl-CoA reductase [Enterococcus ratti]OJG79809.1 YhdH/YhfP family quinone oxidoreductase [Enterococcus ratti]
MNNFKAFQVNNVPTFHTAIIEQGKPILSTNEVLIKIAYSDVNYKDALATSKSGGVIRSYPMTPGIDLSGTVVESLDTRFTAGDLVLLTGYGLGVTHPGGYSQYQKVPGDWLIPLPKNLSLRQAMILGTAGFTALLCVNALLNHGMKKTDKIVITGASGGVGSTAVAILHKLGFSSVMALSRKKEASKWLKDLGANAVYAPHEFFPEKTKPLGKQQINYVLDTVGGEQLTQLLPLIAYDGAATLCGNAGGIQLTATVLPFILRNIQLIGIDSVNVPYEKRCPIWQQLADLSIADELLVNEITFEQLPTVIQQLLAGKHQGRTLVNVGDEK